MDYMLINKKDVFHAIVYYNSMESSTQSLEKWIFTRNSPWFYYSSTPFKIGVHLRTYTVIFKYTHMYKRTYKLISWNQNIRIAHCMYRNRFIFNECISFIINDWKTWYPTVWYISFLPSSIIFLPQLKWPHAHFLS